MNYLSFFLVHLAQEVVNKLFGCPGGWFIYRVDVEFDAVCRGECIDELLSLLGEGAAAENCMCRIACICISAQWASFVFADVCYQS